MNDDLLIIQLRDCFTAGYTFPQFCIDKGIKKPLFVAIDERRADFLWEIFVQFKFDKQIHPAFALINDRTIETPLWCLDILPSLKIESLANIKANLYDKIIFLTALRLNVKIPNAIYFDELKDFFMLRAYLEIPLLHFMQKYPGVKLIVTNHPHPINVEKWRGNIPEKSIHQIREEIRNTDSENVKTPFDFLGYTNEEVLELLELSGVKTTIDGSTVLEDRKCKFVGIKNGKRMTAYQPEKFINKIFFLGSCTPFGIGAPFDKTLESYLQKMLNEHNLPYRVENESQLFSVRWQDIFYNLNNLDVSSGDIVFIDLSAHLLAVALKFSRMPILDVNGILEETQDYTKIFADTTGHLTEIGYKILAEKYFNLLIQYNFFKDAQFNYPAPPPPSSSLRYSERKLSIPCNKIFRQRRIGCAQKIFARTAA